MWSERRACPLLRVPTGYLLHFTAMSNMSLHCSSLVLPFMRTFELVQVRCTACMTSSAARPMAEGEHTKTELVRTLPKGQFSPFLSSLGTTQTTGGS